MSYVHADGRGDSRRCEVGTVPAAGSRPGFTLVELLVVIGIIALLISILLPTLGRARDSASAVKCLAQLRQVGNGLMLYVNDNHGSMPYIWRNNDWKPWSAEQYGVRTSITNPTTDRQKGQYFNFHRAIFKYFGGRFLEGDELMTTQTKVFRCPSAIDFTDVSRAPNDFSDTNYVVNGVMIGRKITKLKKSAKLMCVSENRFSWAVSAVRPYPTGNVTPANLDTLQFRQWMWIEGGYFGAANPVLSFSNHRKNTAGNVLYADGHADTVAYRDVKASDFGLADLAGGGKATDTWVEVSANPAQNYAFDLQN